MAVRSCNATKPAPAARSRMRPKSAALGRGTRSITACLAGVMLPAPQIWRWIAKGGQIAKAVTGGIGRSVSAAMGAAMTWVGICAPRPRAVRAAIRSVSSSQARNSGGWPHAACRAQAASMSASPHGPTAMAELTRPPAPAPRPTRKPPQRTVSNAGQVASKAAARSGSGLTTRCVRAAPPWPDRPARHPGPARPGSYPSPCRRGTDRTQATGRHIRRRRP